MGLILTILGLGLLAFGSFIIVCSYIGQVQNFKNRDNPNGPHISPIPFFGPIISDSWFSFAIGRFVTLDAADFPAPPGYGNGSDWPDLALVQKAEGVVILS